MYVYAMCVYAVRVSDTGFQDIISVPVFLPAEILYVSRIRNLSAFVRSVWMEELRW